MTTVLLIIFGLFAASFLPGTVIITGDVECISDALFENTAIINEFFLKNDVAKNALLILCSGMMDICMIVMFYRFLFKQVSWRWLLAMVMFYGTRFFIQKTFLMKFPDGYAWDYPGFPSLTVPYPKTNDFFYSGHVGGAMIAALEFHSQNCLLMAYFGYLTAGMQVVLMIFLRSHYSIDLIGGLVFAHYYFIWATRWHSWVDHVVCRQPIVDESLAG
jgi:hypothetical protein